MFKNLKKKTFEEIRKYVTIGAAITLGVVILIGYFYGNTQLGSTLSLLAYGLFILSWILLLVLAREELPDYWGELQNPILLSAVGSHKARALIREFLNEAGFVEGTDYLCIM